MFFAWIVLPLLAVVLTAVFLYWKIYKGIQYFTGIRLKRGMQRLAAAAGMAVLVLPAFRFYGTWFLVLLHFAVFLLFGELVFWLYDRIRKGKERPKAMQVLYKSGICAVVLTAAVISYGFYNMYHVRETEYTVETGKTIQKEGYRMAVVSDLHYGISLNGEQLQEAVSRIEAENPDFVILDGDIVDERTTREEMEEAFSILGSMTSKYGIFYVYGNHDKNAYTTTPNYTAEELAETIRHSGITILEDDTVEINGELLLIGRGDKGERNGRKEISELTEGQDPEKFWIILDHQPAEYAKVQQAGGGLIVSGHTHAGQIWPIGLFASLFHFDDMNYGYRQMDIMQALVTSGIAGWGFPIRTEKHCEYLIVNLVPEA